MKIETLATFDSPVQAQPLLDHLRAAGVRAAIHDESKFEWLWFVRRPRAGVRLDVDADDSERAIRLWHEMEAARGPMVGVVHCPECGSARVEYPQITRKFVTPNVVGLFARLGLVEMDFYCQDCQFTWPGDPPKQPRPHPHLSANFMVDRLNEAHMPWLEVEGLPQRPPRRVWWHKK
jgi:hypothetical protein